MSEFIQRKGNIYAANATVAATAVVTTATLIGKIEGAVNLEPTYTWAESYWRQRTLQNRTHTRIDMTLTCEDVEFIVSNMSNFFSPVSTATQTYLYGDATSASAHVWKFRVSTAPKSRQFVFEFQRSDNNEYAQLYCPKVQMESFPLAFAPDDYTKHNLTFRLMATGGVMFELLDGNAS